MTRQPSNTKKHKELALLCIATKGFTDMKAIRRKISWRTIMRAKKDLGIRSSKHRFDGQWTWELPAASQDLRYLSTVAADEECQKTDRGYVAPFDRAAYRSRRDGE
jgi:hypothetical protein